MKKSSKKGFTLVEIVCVIAIIILLSTVFVVGVRPYLDAAKSRADLVNDHAANQDKWARIQSEVDAPLVGFTRPTVPSETTDNTPHPGPGPGGNPGGNPGGGAPDPSTSGETEPGGGGTETAPSGDTTEPSEPNEGPQNAPGSSYTYNNPSDYWGGQMKFDNAPRTIIVQVDTDGNSNFDVNANGMYTCEPMGNGKYKVTFVADTWASPIKNITFHIDNGYDFHIVEYS